MKYNAPYGVSDPNAAYVNGNPATATPGSIPPAASIEFPQREIVNLINNTGIVPDNADLNQLARGIQSGQLTYGLDTGSANAYSIALSPPPLQYWDGLAIWVIPANANTGPSTINVSGLGFKNIVRRGGDPLQAGDMPANYKSLLTYSKLHNNFELYGINFAAAGGGGGPGFLPILTANTVWYVNGGIGSDTLYDGTTATVSGPHGPFKTIGKATATIFQYGPSVYTATVMIAAGTYPEQIIIPPVPGPAVSYIGASMTNTFVTGLPTGVANTVHLDSPNRVTVKGIGISVGTGDINNNAFYSANGGQIWTDDCQTNGTVRNAVWCSFGGIIYPGAHTFGAGHSGAYGMQSIYSGQMQPQYWDAPGHYVVRQRVWTFLGAMTVTQAFAACGPDSTILIPTPYQMTFVNPGYVSGYKYMIRWNGIIAGGGIPLSYLPGSAAGWQDTGGQYASN
jgi:hypothetical protein